MNNHQVPRRVENVQTDRGSLPVYATGTVEQPWDSYTETDHAVWCRLYRRQREILPGRASDAFLRAQDTMGMTPDRIPKFSDLNRVLADATGWQIVGVEGLLPELVFFDHLANRRFPVSWWIRRPDQVDYIEEPDLFHDLFGHVPLLMDPMFADDLVAYGKGGVRPTGSVPRRGRSWRGCTGTRVEFGDRQPDQLRIDGAGIVVRGRVDRRAGKRGANRIGFALERVTRTRYRIDSDQRRIVIDSYEEIDRGDPCGLHPDLRTPARAGGDPGRQRARSGDRVQSRHGEG